jgi:hypothetical protein
VRVARRAGFAGRIEMTLTAETQAVDRAWLVFLRFSAISHREAAPCDRVTAVFLRSSP